MRKRNKRGRPRSKESHLKKLREKRKIKFEDALKVLDISPPGLYKLESGETKPSIETAQAMCKLYNCKLEDIYISQKEVV